MINRYLLYFASGSLVVSPLTAVHPSAERDALQEMQSDYDADDFYQDKGVHESQESQNLEHDIYQKEWDVEQQTIQKIEKR